MENTASKHTRNISRSSRPRSTTKGPLDQPDDPLNAEILNASTSPTSGTADRVFSGASFSKLDPLAPDELPPTVEKDLSYLLRYDVYHSLSQIEIPPALRSEFIAPTSDESLSSSLATLERLLAEGHFLLAAYLCGTILTSSLISPTDIKRIFILFYTRLACLQLSGNTILAAQESKALEDLSSAFYYVEQIPKESEKKPEYPRHIVPWPLRVQAVRLQSIGFGDSRRGIGGMYEIGLEARREILQPDLTPEERAIWRARLSDLGMRIVNALIEMGDVNAARRSLNNLRMSEPESEAEKLRKALLLLLIGDVDAAKQVCGGPGDAENALFIPLLSMAEGRYDDAAQEWRALLDTDTQRSDAPMISQNLAVCLLYTGHLNEARDVLESLVRENHSFSSLVFNLSTVYELCSDKSAKLKTDLTETVARQPVTGVTNLDRHNADFKL
ncbi:hypothetical protein BO71DRAFT_335788 [Aspergillus ellipticus CBS 707.79]|uniref:Trafficking protein particle complex subunit 12 n=1 Tax=Aspergillus ellipticus CBS 707.79 TaxID=1448320 RepID=A0A319CYM9_9EURO|nr:hypothetical protein BO71DRAFT_335788 [Aspergillus ellipticus CBS 707.79]